MGPLSPVPQAPVLWPVPPPRCPRDLGPCYVVSVLFDTVLNWSLGLLASALQNEEFLNSNCPFVAVAHAGSRISFPLLLPSL